MVRFSPFNKEFRDIVTEDLQKLEGVSEGWYVEYKQTIPKAKNISKSISSFANQYGGWLFFGILADQDGHNIPQSFSGIGKEEWGQFQDRLSSSISGHLSPFPDFEFKFLEGPFDPIGLKEGRGIVVVHVPQGSNSPYVHSTGCIFRRLADQSQPVPETDRTALDLLWDRKNKAEGRLKEFLQKEPELSQGESEVPRLDLYFFSDPLGDRQIWEPFGVEDFKSIVGGSDGKNFEIIFDQVYSTTDGFYARQCKGNEVRGLCPTLRYFFNGTTIAHLPIRAFKANDPKGLFELQKYKHGEQFFQILRSQGLQDAYWMDLNLLLAFFVGTYVKHRRLCGLGSIRVDSMTKSRFSSLWRKIPFVDSESYLRVLKTQGVPVIQENEIWSPPHFGVSSLDSIEFHEVDDIEKGLIGAGGAWGFSLAALGLRSLFTTDSIEELLKATNQAIRTHSRFKDDEGEE